MPIDLNNAPPQRSGELIPAGTILAVHMAVRPGGAGEGGWLKRSKDGGSHAVDTEYTVITEGPHQRRKFWSLMTIEGSTDGHNKAAEISFGRLRAILESVHGIRPDDESPEARAKRQFENYGHFNSLRFLVKVGIEKGKDNFPDKNSLAEVITPDKKAWVKVEQVSKTQDAAVTYTPPASANGAASKPAWA